MQDWEILQPDEYRLLDKHYTAGRGGYTINKIVLHHNAGNLSIQGCWNVWQTRPASAHYQVDANGRIGQLVNDWDTAWHAGDWDANCSSIGIEHADISSNPWRISDATLDNGAHLVAALCKHYGLGEPTYGKNVFFHSDFQATSCPASIAGSQRDAYLTRAKEWYRAMTGHGSAPTGSPSAPVQPETSATPTVPVHYALRQLNGAWWPDVTNFGGGDDGYAGAPYTSHDLLMVWADKGRVRYRVHTVASGWLPWVDHADRNDLVNGVAGNPGEAIDGVQIYYETPDDLTKKNVYYQAYYRAQTTERSGWLPVCCDDGTTYEGYDGWAGMIGEPIDRLQIAISDGNPF